MSTIDERIQDLRDEYADVLQEREEEAAAAALRQKKLIDERLNGVIVELYQSLLRAVTGNTGCGKDVVLYVGCSLGYSCCEYLFERIKEKTGLTVEKMDDDRYMTHLRVKLTDTEAKKYRTIQDGELVELDFPALILINQNQNKLWDELVPGLARGLLNKAREWLKQMPDNYCGVSEDITVLGTDWQPLLLRMFKFERPLGTSAPTTHKEQIYYTALRENRLTSLRDQMNALIVHGTVDFVKDEEGSWQVHLKKVPGKLAEVRASPFDYGVFCEQYDKMNPTLQDVLSHITENLQVASEWDQIRKLQPEHNLYYTFDLKDDALDYALLSSKLSRDPQKQWLIDAVNAAVTGIRVTDVKFEAEKDYKNNCYTRQQIVLAYKIVGKTGTLMKSQVETERKIRCARKCFAYSFASRTIKRILDEVERRGLEYYIDKSDSDKMTGYLGGLELKSRMLFGLDTYVVDLKQVQDKKCRKRIEREIARLTDGVITVSFEEWEYYLHLD